MAQQSHFLSMKKAFSFSTACSAAWGVLTGRRKWDRTLLPSPHPHRWFLSGAVGASTSPSPNVMCHSVLAFHELPLYTSMTLPTVQMGKLRQAGSQQMGSCCLWCCFQLTSQGQCASSTHTSCRAGIHKPKPNSSTKLSHRQSASQWIWVPEKV